MSQSPHPPNEQVSESASSKPPLADAGSNNDPSTMGPVRERLEDTREAITHKFNIAGHEGYIIVGRYPDGRPGELFIKMAKQGSTISGLMDTVGILTSLVLQYGVPIDTLARKLEHVRFEPSGWTPNPDIGNAQSVVDYIYRWLGMQFDDEYRATKERDARQQIDTSTWPCRTI